MMQRSTAALAMALCSVVGATALAGAARAADPQPGPGDWRPVDAANTLVIDTNQGRIIAELYPDIAPQSVARLETLARQHFYDGLTFFRVIDDFMDQTGDPKNTGEGGSTLPDLVGEFTFRRSVDMPFAKVAQSPGEEMGYIGVMPVVTKPMAQGALTEDGKVAGEALFCPGVIGIARADDPNSANSQFFIMRQDHPSLDGHYAAVGRVVVGEDVARKIKVGEPAPDPQDRMLKVQVLADMPEATRPKVMVIDTHSAYFTALTAPILAARGGDFSTCDVDVAGMAK